MYDVALTPGPLTIWRRQGFASFLGQLDALRHLCKLITINRFNVFTSRLTGEIKACVKAVLIMLPVSPFAFGRNVLAFPCVSSG